MNSPGTKNNASGPFEVVDLDGYAVKPGYSGDIYGSRTMHAIGWVLRHTYPYMIVDTGYADSDVWSRVAGQFAIREVVKQLEGDWYVRDYWRMDEFYRASGQAPGDYLEYARWLAACAIEHAAITGEIGISSKSVHMQGGSYVGTVTLTTDADLIRISRSVGNLTGNSAGSDGEYYYLHSGDTISVTSSQSTFSITAQSVSSQDEEAAFLIGIPNADIQKVIIPQYGLPAKMKEVRIEFEQPYGAVRVSKISADNGAVLSGATFELMNGAGTVLATQTTGADGTARFDNIPAGGYTVREVGAPTGYKIAVNPSQAVTVAPGATSDIRFENDRVNGKIRIVKRDALTKEALAGAVFTVTRLSAAEGGGAVGEAVVTLTTGADGTAETGWLQWGRYRVAETGVPKHYVDGGFVTEIDCTEDGKTYAVEAENEPTKGWIRLVKTDRLNGNPIEGVAFDIYENDEYGNALVADMTTGKDGAAVSPPLRKGRYIVRERGATAGYVLEEIALDATVRSDETTQLCATNQPVMVKLKLYRRDGDEYGGDDPNSRRRDELPQPANIDAPSTHGDGELTGAIFRVLAGAEIRDRQGNVLFKKGDTVVDALTTAGGDASAATGELWPGLYEIVEASPPVGYEPSDAHFFVDARSAASQSETAVVTYEGLKLNIIRQGVYAIVKFLGDNEIHDDAGLIETPEEGAEFELYLKKAGSYGNARAFERDYLVTNKYGYAKTKLLPYGLYVLKQVKGKAGHALKSPVEIFIRGDEDVANPPILTINNQAIRYRLKLIKTDTKTGKTVRLANTAFKLLDSDGNVVTQTVSYPTRREIDTFYHYFTWQGMDGSEIVSFLYMDYTSRTDAATVVKRWKDRVQKRDITKFLLPFGYGDGGGGPTRDHIENVLREKDLEGVPKVQMESPQKFFEDCAQDGAPKNRYVGELYFQCHRGTYTTQAAIKRGNRKSELALREAEIWSIAAQDKLPYPTKELDRCWKNVLLNQFHDILPGSSIARVYEEANKLYSEVLNHAEQIVRCAQEMLTQGDGWSYFNSLSWTRKALVQTEEGYGFAVIPPMGATSSVDKTEPEQPVYMRMEDEELIMGNGLIEIRLNNRGEMVDCRDEQGCRKIGEQANVLCMYKDVPRKFDAWDIDSMYPLSPVELNEESTIEPIENTPWHCSARVTRRIGHSDWVQIISMTAGKRQIDFDTEVSWHETHRLLKVAFQTGIQTDEAINEIQFGYVRRPTHQSRRYDADRFEVCNHRYTALCDEGRGAAVLNESKYGVSQMGDTIALTLLRAAKSPDFHADQGKHHFAYSYYIWNGSFVDSDVVRAGYELNVPVTRMKGYADFSLLSIDKPNVVIETVKAAEDGSGDTIVRLYESKHASCTAELTLNMPVRHVYACNMLERELDEIACEEGKVKLNLHGFEIKTLRLKK